MKATAWQVGLLVLVGPCMAGCRNKGDQGRDNTGQASQMTPKEAEERLATINDLTCLALNLHNYQSNYGHFPSVDGTPEPEREYLSGLSWKAQISLTDSDDNPFKDWELEELLRAYSYAKTAKPSESWNLAELLKIPIIPYRCAIEGKTKSPGDTFYRVFVGKGAAFEHDKKLRVSDFTDGLENTILVVEAATAVPWTKPDELEYDPTKPLPKVSAHFPDGFYAAFGDGSVRLVPNDIDERTLRAMITRNGGEKIEKLPEKVNTEHIRPPAPFPPDGKEIVVELVEAKASAKETGDRERTFQFSVKYRFTKGPPKEDHFYRLEARIPGFGRILSNEVIGKEMKAEGTLENKALVINLDMDITSMEIYMTEKQDSKAPFLKISNVTSTTIQ